MKAHHSLAAVVALAALHADVQALTPQSDSDGPVRLLNCVISPNGILQAEVDNQSDHAMSCSLRCDYKIVDQTFSHWFELTIPKRFNGRIGRFDTSGGAKAGNYPGSVVRCEKTDSDTGMTIP